MQAPFFSVASLGQLPISQVQVKEKTKDSPLGSTPLAVGRAAGDTLVGVPGVLLLAGGTDTVGAVLRLDLAWRAAPGLLADPARGTGGAADVAVGRGVG